MLSYAQRAAAMPVDPWATTDPHHLTAYRYQPRTPDMNPDLIPTQPTSPEVLRALLAVAARRHARQAAWGTG
jgi:hypothetical protein